MAHLSDRRYRLNAPEVGPVMALVADRLGELVEAREDFNLAQILFIVLYRFKTYQVGRPAYPDPITWEIIEDWLKDNGPLEEAPRRE